MKTRKTYYIDCSLIKEIKQYAFFNDMKISEVVVTAIRDYFKKKNNKKRGA